MLLVLVRMGLVVVDGGGGLIIAYTGSAGSTYSGWRWITASQYATAVILLLLSRASP